jgi:putative transcriptional regulator
MKSLFEDLNQGLQEAIDFANGKGPARVTTNIIKPVKELNNEEIKQVTHNSRVYKKYFCGENPGKE